MTTTMTTTHNSLTCTLGVDGSRCHECEYQYERALLRADAGVETAAQQPHPPMSVPEVVQAIASFLRKGSDGVGGDWECDEAADAVLAGLGETEPVEPSAAELRRRQSALLERAAPDLPTEGASALATAYLADESWFLALDNNAMEDEARLELAQAIERVVEGWLESRRQAWERVLRMKGEAQ